MIGTDSRLGFRPLWIKYGKGTLRLLWQVNLLKGVGNPPSGEETCATV